ncbi:phosphopantetheine-binding protein [Kitasatospora saccharophila]|uniref:phosphopantetheine-binding protein n=1 Tax=Kitasatospora saccharophila TaxID=407973 RepID=UPI00363857EB
MLANCSRRSWAWSGSAWTTTSSALGGHSLLATRLAARIRAATKRSGAAQVFGHPTVAALAAVLRPAGAGARPALVAQRRPDPLPLSFATSSGWRFLNRTGTAGAGAGSAGGDVYNVPLVLALDGPLDACRAAAGAGRRAGAAREPAHGPRGAGRRGWCWRRPRPPRWFRWRSTLPHG